MSRRYRRWPPSSYVALLLIGLAIATRAGCEGFPVGDVEREQSEVAASDALLQAGPCEVERVVDGDTLIVRQPANRTSQYDSPAFAQSPTAFRVRLLGVDTPETVKEDTPVEAWGPEATAFTKEFVRRGPVSLELDKRRQDRFGRSLAYVYVGDELLNVELVRAGLARVSHYPGDSMAKLRLLREAEAEARHAERGIWSKTSMAPEASR